MSRLTAVVLCLVLAEAAQAQTLFNSNGFESSAGYTLGNLIGQNGWTVDTAAGQTYVVQNTVAAGGAGQAAQVTGGITNWAFPDATFTPADPTTQGVRIQADLARGTPFSATNSFGYTIDVYDTNTARITRFGLVNSNGNILPFVTSRFNTTTGQYDSTQPISTVVLSNTPIPANTFVNFDARLNYATKTLALSVNGVEVGATIPFANLTSTNFADADFQVSSAAGALDVGYLDNYIVTVAPVPEPATCGLVAVGGLLAVRRLRRLVA